MPGMAQIWGIPVRNIRPIEDPNLRDLHPEAREAEYDCPRCDEIHTTVLFPDELANGLKVDAPLGCDRQDRRRFYVP